MCVAEQEVAELSARVAVLERQVARIVAGGASIATGALPIGMLTRADAAKFLGLQPTTLHSWAHRGIGPRFKVWRNKAYYCRQDLEAWAAENMRDARGGKRRAPEAEALPLLDCL